MRRSGSRLRDSDSQDVQFLETEGSTDSEVRKILTLHIPITEYDTTLGSESDNECSAKSLKQTKYKTQRGENRSNTSNGFSNGIFVSAVDETSSSSENSPSNVSRKSKPSYPSRKSAKSSAMMKRHVRSSSGYSSHNEETTFR